MGVFISEATLKSGSSSTASYAIEQGKDIFAFPGKADDFNYTGTNLLIQNGASLVTCARDILLDYEPLYPDKIMTDNISMEGYKRKVRREEQTRVLSGTDFKEMPFVREEPRKTQQKESPKNGVVKKAVLPVV